MNVWFMSRFNDLNTVHVQMVHLYTEKSQAFKNDWNPFLSFVFDNG